LIRTLPTFSLRQLQQINSKLAFVLNNKEVKI